MITVVIETFARCQLYRLLYFDFLLSTGDQRSLLQLSILLFKTFLRLSTTTMLLLQNQLQECLVHPSILRACFESLSRWRLRRRRMDR